MNHTIVRLRMYWVVLGMAALFISSCASSRLKLGKVPLKKHFYENRVFSESHTGLLVYDLADEKVVFDYNGHKHFTPASNTKLLTYLAAISMLPDSIAALRYCLTQDTLYFTGTGDPTLLYDPFEYGKTLEYLKAHEHTLAYVSTPMAEGRFGPGWSWDDYPYYYSAEKSSFPIYGNMVYFQKEKDADYLTVMPGYFEEHLKLKQDQESANASIHREETKNEFELTFSTAPIEFDDALPFIYSDELFVDLLADTLDREVQTIDYFPNCKSELLYNIPTDSVSKYILIRSDNFLAEQMLVMISNQLGDTLSSKKSIEFMMENQLVELEDEIHWVDGSGLSRYNLVTPNAMIHVLKDICRRVPKDKLYYMLPEAGRTGTLKDSFSGLSGKIHAKTGSMSHVYNLSGYMQTNSGKTLLFSFMNNNFNVSFSELKHEMEKVLAVFIINK